MDEKEKESKSSGSTHYEDPSEGERYKSSARFQLILFCSFGLFLVWLLYQPVVDFKTNDQYPAIVSMTPQQIIDLGGAPIGSWFDTRAMSDCVFPNQRQP